MEVIFRFFWILPAQRAPPQAILRKCPIAVDRSVFWVQPERLIKTGYCGFVRAAIIFFRTPLCGNASPNLRFSGLPLQSQLLQHSFRRVLPLQARDPSSLWLSPDSVGWHHRNPRLPPHSHQGQPLQPREYGRQHCYSHLLWLAGWRCHCQRPRFDSTIRLLRCVLVRLQFAPRRYFVPAAGIIGIG